MAVNTFIQDSQDGNPLIRALAVRTMCRIRLENVAEYMVTPLKKTLKDKDPYVRKTAAFGVSKLYDVIPEVVESSGLFEDLLNLVQDSNPMVVSNSLAAIYEINDHRPTPIFVLDSFNITPVVAAIPDCSAWCQTLLFDALSRYLPQVSEDADYLIEKFLSFLKHNNPAVVIGSFRCLFFWLGRAGRLDPSEVLGKIIPPFVTLITSASPEIQYVVLRALGLFIQKYPKSLVREIRVFFCKYNDPTYVKLEKLDIMVTICGAQNAQLVLDELADYAKAVDVQFVRKSVRCIGQIGIKIEAAARRCVDILVSLVSGKADYAVEESIVVVTDILRKYPGQFEGILQTVCQGLAQVKEPRAKAAGIWILGEYSDIIEGVELLLDPFLDTFHDEGAQVQLQILSALVKLFINRPDETRDQLQFVLNEATKDVNVPDVKNRALIYWRILSADLQVAKDVVVFGKEATIHSGVHFDDAVLEELIRNMGKVAGVLHVVPADFVSRVSFTREADDLQEIELRHWSPVSLADATLVELFSDADRAALYLRIAGKSATPLTGFALAINTNAVGLTIAGTPVFPPAIEFGDVVEVRVDVRYDAAAVGNRENAELQIALRTAAATIFGLARIPIECATLPSGNIGIDRFREYYGGWTAAVAVKVASATLETDAGLAARNVFVVGRSEQGRLYLSFQLPGKELFVAEVAQQETDIVAVVKAQEAALLPLVQQNLQYLLGQIKE